MQRAASPAQGTGTPGEEKRNDTPADGSDAAIKLNVPHGFAQEVLDFTIGPRGRTVVYRSRDDTIDLWRVSIDGQSEPRRLYTPIAGANAFSRYRISRSGLFVAFVADLEIDEEHQLYSAPLHGPEAYRRASGDLVPFGDVDYCIQIVGNLVVYMADQDLDEFMELFLTSLPAPKSRTPSPTRMATRNAPSSR